MPEVIVFAVSITAVVVGADWLGNSATHIARGFSLSRVLIGATIVSVATTLPEITVAIFSSAEHSPGIGLGTVLGSPIANIGLIFGILLIFSKTRIDKVYFSRTIQFFLIVLTLVFVFSLNGSVSLLSSLVLIFFGLLYLAFQFVIGKQEAGLFEEIESRFERLRGFFTTRKNYHHLYYLVLGASLLVLGAHFLVNSAAILAASAGIPSIVIGIVIVAFGTSLPELFTTVDSIIKNRSGLGIGNLFGASVLDLSLALGLGGVFNGITIRSSELYITVGALAILSSISLLYVFEKIPPKILGVLLIGTYVISLIWFGGFDR